MVSLRVSLPSRFRTLTVDSYFLSQTYGNVWHGFAWISGNHVCHLCWICTSKVAKHQQFNVLAATKSINRWEVRMYVKPLIEELWQTFGHPDRPSTHTCMWAHTCLGVSIGLTLGSGLLPDCRRISKSLSSPAKYWHIPNSCRRAGKPSAIVKCHIAWGQASYGLTCIKCQYTADGLIF